MYKKVAIILQYSTDADYQLIESFINQHAHRIIFVMHLQPDEIAKIKVKRKDFGPEEQGIYNRKVDNYIRDLCTMLNVVEAKEEYRKYIKDIKVELPDGDMHSLNILLKYLEYAYPEEAQEFVDRAERLEI